MKTPPHGAEKYRIQTGSLRSDSSYGNNGAFFIKSLSHPVLKVIASDGDLWEHVSVSLPDRTPNWDEMCLVKDIFWEDEEEVVQFHPPKSEYVNVHKYCLHLWKPKGFEIPRPPRNLIE